MEGQAATTEIPEDIITRFREGGFDRFMAELGTSLDLNADEANRLRATIENFIAEQVVTSRIDRTERSLGELRTHQSTLRRSLGLTTNVAARTRNRTRAGRMRARKLTTSARTRRTVTDVDRVLSKLPKRFGREHLVKVVGQERARTLPAQLTRRGLISSRGGGWYEKRAAAAGLR